MAKKFSLEPLTVLGCAPPEMTYIAARTGYEYVSFRLIPMGVPGEAACSPGDREMIRKTRAALQETGVKLHDIELARIVKDVEPAAYVPAMEVAAELGARHLIASAWTGERNDRDFVVDRYAEICDLARPFGLTVSLEFPSFSRLTNLQEAADIVRAAGRHNCGILVDTLYFHLSQVSLQELAALPREWFHFLHISDTRREIPTTREGLIHIARDERLYPGEGCIDFAAIAALFPDVIYAIELPNLEQVRKYGFEGHARRCLDAARRVLEQPPPVPEKSCHRPADSASAR